MVLVVNLLIFYMQKFDLFFLIKTPSKRGFTLIELLVVISIISLLSSVILSSLNSARTKARDARRQEDLNTLAKSLEIYYSNHEAYPVCSFSVNDNIGHAVSLVCLNAALIADHVINSPIQDPLNGSSPSTYSYAYDNYCSTSTPGVPTYRAWVQTENQQPYQKGMWWGTAYKTLGITSCINPI